MRCKEKPSKYTKKQQYSDAQQETTRAPTLKDDNEQSQGCRRATYSPSPTVYAYIKRKQCYPSNATEPSQFSNHQNISSQQWINVPASHQDSNQVNYCKAYLGQTTLLLNNSVQTLWRGNWCKTTEQNDYIDKNKTYATFDDDKNLYQVEDGPSFSGSKLMKNQISTIKQPVQLTQQRQTTTGTDFSKVGNTAHMIAYNDRVHAKQLAHKNNINIGGLVQRQQSSNEYFNRKLMQDQAQTELQTKAYLLPRAEEVCKKFNLPQEQIGQFVNRLDCQQLEKLVTLDNDLQGRV